MHRVYPALTEETVTGNGTGERAVTGGETALAEANARAAMAEARLFDSKSMLEDSSRWAATVRRNSATSSSSLTTRSFRSACERRSTSGGGDIPRMNLTRAPWESYNHTATTFAPFTKNSRTRLST